MSSPEDWKKWEGRVDGKFPLRRWLGGSEHSAVFLTERTGHADEKVAIKLTAGDSPEAEHQLAQWRAAGQLSHPHLMRIYEAGRCRLDGTPLLYVVTEYAEEDLSEILPQRPLAPNEVTDLLPPLLDALSYLHSKGFVHGRVKPSNVHAMGEQLKLSADQIISFNDPNPARRRRDVYDAPETAAGIISPAGDVWSIGVTLVAALTQKVSFDGEAAQRDPDPPETVPPPFRGIARECLHLDPNRRCSLDQIQARLQPAGRSVPVVAATQADRASHSPNKTTSRVLIPIAVLVVFALGFGVLRWLSGSKGGRESGAMNVVVPQDASQPSAAQTSATQPSAAQPPPFSTPASPPAAKPSASRGEVAHQSIPEVSQSARNTITGTIKINVRVEVDSTGKVTSAKLTSAQPSKYFTRLSLEAAQNWKFAPPTSNGDPAASTWVIQFRYKRSSTQASAQRANR